MSDLRSEESLPKVTSHEEDFSQAIAPVSDLRSEQSLADVISEEEDVNDKSIVSQETGPVDVLKPEEMQEQVVDSKLEIAKSTPTTLLELLISRAVTKSEVLGSIPHMNEINDRLFEKIRPQVENLNFDISERDMDKLFKKIFKSICKKLHCSEGGLLTLMDLEDPDMDNIIVYKVNKHLRNAMEKPSIIKRIFSWTKR